MNATAKDTNLYDRIREAHQSVIARLRELGAEVRTNMVQDGAGNAYGRVERVNGELVSLSICQQQRPGGLIRHGNGRLYATVGNYGSKRNFPEGRDGLSIDKIADALVAQAKGYKTQREAAAARREATTSANEFIHDLKVTLGLPEYTGPVQIDFTGSSFRVQANYLTREQAERVARAILNALA